MSYICSAPESVVRMRDCGDRAWTSVGASMPLLELFRLSDE